MTTEKLKQTLQALLNRLKTDKRALVLLCAAALLLLAIVGADLHTGKKAKSQAEAAPAPAAQESDEARLCALLESIRGAGKTRVMLTYSEGEKTVYACAADSENEQSGASFRSREKRDPVLLKGGDGQSGLVERTLSPVVQGVAVVCEGAGDPAVRARIVAAISALFSLGANHIIVAEMAN